MKQILAFITFIGSFTSLTLAHIFQRMTPLSQGLARYSEVLLILGFVTLLAGIISVEKQLSKLCMILTSSFLLAWLALCGLLYLNQDRLLFSPRNFPESKRIQIAQEYPTSTELFLQTEDMLQIQGWFVRNKTGDKVAPLVIVFPGQGGEASSYLKFSEQIPQFSWVFFNYRSYGLSQGKPSDTNLFLDSLTIFDYFSSNPQVDPENIFVLGGSLGTGVATYLASKRPVRGVVLFSPYDKIGGGVAQEFMPLLPTRLLIQNTFDAIQFAPEAQGPALAIIGAKDLVIRPHRSKEILNNWGKEVTILHQLAGDHYSVYEAEESWETIRHFFFSLLE